MYIYLTDWLIFALTGVLFLLSYTCLMMSMSCKSASCHAQRKWILSKYAFLGQEKFYQKETGFLFLVIIYEYVYYIDRMVVWGIHIYDYLFLSLYVNSFPVAPFSSAHCLMKLIQTDHPFKGLKGSGTGICLENWMQTWINFLCVAMDSKKRGRKLVYQELGGLSM